MDDASLRAARTLRSPRALMVAALVVLVASGKVHACDGKSYSLDLGIGQIASGGGLAVQLDKLKLRENLPDSYTIQSRTMPICSPTRHDAQAIALQPHA